MSNDTATTNEKIKPFMNDPTLYRTTVITESNETFVYHSWSEGNDIQTAEDTSMMCLYNDHGVTDADATEVTTEKVDKP